MNPEPNRLLQVLRERDAEKRAAHEKQAERAVDSCEIATMLRRCEDPACKHGQVDILLDGYGRDGAGIYRWEAPRLKVCSGGFIDESCAAIDAASTLEALLWEALVELSAARERIADLEDAVQQAPLEFH